MLTRRNLLKATLGLTALSLAGCGGGSTPVAPPIGPIDALEQLARSLRGPLLRPDSAGYLEAALPWNLRFASILPTAVARCLSPEDVRTALLWAQDNGVPLVARSGGHSYAGYSTTTGLMIDLTLMNQTEFNPGTAQLRMGGGARNQNVEDALRPVSRALPHGRCPQVGVAGLTLGGGIGFDMRLDGLTCDKLLETQVVTAAGEILRCNERENADLFWACRGGGGGNFGINTSFTFDTYAVGRLTAYDLTWTQELDTLLPLALQLLPTFPPELGAKLTVINDGTSLTLDLLGQLRGGTPQQLRALFDPFFQVAQPSSQRIEVLDYWDGQDFLADPDSAPDYSDERSRYIFSAFAAEGAAVILDFLRNWPGTGGVANWKIFLAGGAVAEVPSDATAYVHRGALMISSIELDWLETTPQEVVELNQAWQDEFHQAMAPFTSEQSYQNFIDESERNFLEAYYGSNLPRLVEIKHRYDPRDVFRFPQGIPTTLA